MSQVAMKGPSPRARDRRRGTRWSAGASRTIPACTGPTIQPAPNVPPTQDHPRVYGADSRAVLPSGRPYGPSPRVRGRRLNARTGVGSDGTIPACAGPTPRPAGRSQPGPDHPRVRGADGPGIQQRPQQFGPSPRVRGRPRAWTCRMVSTRDHPRTRGADHNPRSVEDPIEGPSPHARGRLLHAGKTHRDQPRVCETDGTAGLTDPPRAGPSPRVRG